jgi:hypothetical protein
MRRRELRVDNTGGRSGRADRGAANGCLRTGRSARAMKTLDREECSSCHRGPPAIGQPTFKQQHNARGGKVPSGRCRLYREPETLRRDHRSHHLLPIPLPAAGLDLGPIIPIGKVTPIELKGSFQKSAAGMEGRGKCHRDSPHCWMTSGAQTRWSALDLPRVSKVDVAAIVASACQARCSAIRSHRAISSAFS